MPCPIQIKDNIVKEINKMSGDYINKSPSFIKILQNTINNKFKASVVTFVKQVDDTFLSKIHIPQSLIDEYYEYESIIEGDKKDFYQEKVKPGVQELFESNPELANIGTTEQYSQYLDTIFPDSKVKDIVYHGTPEGEFENFDISKAGKVTGTSTKGIYFTDSKKTADFYAEGSIDFSQFESREEYEAVKKAKVFSAILNAKNLKLVDNPQAQEKQGNAILRTKEKLSDKGFVGELDYAHQYIVFEPEQIHILGGKQDMQGFKKFVNNKNYNTKSTPSSPFNEYGVTHEEWDNASESEREMIIWQFKNQC